MKKIPQPPDPAGGGPPSARDRAEAAARPAAEGRPAGRPEALEEVARASAAVAEGTADGPLAPPASPDGPGRAGAGRADRPRARRRGAGAPRGPSLSQARRQARVRALQALYQWDMAGSEASGVRREFLERQDMSRTDVDYFERLFRGVAHDVERVDEALAGALDRPLGDVDPIERAVLRIAAYELAEVPETPARVAINEGVEITRRFGADNGHRYVNGVLDRLAGELRPAEMRRG